LQDASNPSLRRSQFAVSTCALMHPRCLRHTPMAWPRSALGVAWGVAQGLSRVCPQVAQSLTNLPMAWRAPAQGSSTPQSCSSLEGRRSSAVGTLLCRHQPRVEHPSATTPGAGVPAIFQEPPNAQRACKRHRSSSDPTHAPTHRG